MILRSSMLVLFLGFIGEEMNAQVKKIKTSSGSKKHKQELKMKIEIWSDVACPFCYIGKHKLDSAIQSFPELANVKVEWKSFQLDPDIASSALGITEYLSQRKGMSVASVAQMIENVKYMGAQSGLDLNFEKVIIANSFKAHRLLHFAKEKGLQHETEEALFEAHFTHGKNISDDQDLIEAAMKVGLDKSEAEAILKSNKYTDEVAQDIKEASELKIQGVPFFIFNRKYAVSGAQDVSVFKKVLRTSYDEWQKDSKKELEVIEGKVCTPEKKCN